MRVIENWVNRICEKRVRKCVVKFPTIAWWMDPSSTQLTFFYPSIIIIIKLKLSYERKRFIIIFSPRACVRTCVRVKMRE